MSTGNRTPQNGLRVRKVKRDSYDFTLPGAVSARELSRLRLQALKAGDIATADAVRVAQGMRKKGLHAHVEAHLYRKGISLESRGMATSFPEFGRLSNRSYRVAHNLKGESRRRVAGEPLLVKKTDVVSVDVDGVGTPKIITKPHQVYRAENNADRFYAKFSVRRDSDAPQPVLRGTNY